MKNNAGSVFKYFTRTGERLWRYRFDIAPVDGCRQRVDKAGFATRGDARKACDDAIKAHLESKMHPAPPAPAKETVKEWLTIWLRDYAPHQCAPKTLERYRELAGYVLDATAAEPAALAATPLVDLKHTAVEAALYALLRMRAKRREHLAPKTVREIASVLSVSLNKAFRLDKIASNPLLKVELPKVERVEARALTQEEMERLRKVCRGDWTLTFIDIGLATGARRGELLALEWPDIDWMTSTLTISKSLEQTAAGLRVKRPKSDRVRKFRLGQTAIASLRFLNEQQQEHRRMYGADYEGALVFCQPGGLHLDPALVSQTIVRRLSKAGIKNASLHTLRHTLASHLLSNGVPLTVVSKMLGHADANVTLRIYSHMLPDDDTRAADTWEKIIVGGPGAESASAQKQDPPLSDVKPPIQ
jgi:integrase